MHEYVLSIASETQKEQLRDGFVSFEMYERAFLNAVQCFRDGGIETTLSMDLTGRFYDYEAQLGDDSVVDANHAIVLECNFEHLDAILDAWGSVNQATRAELNEAREALLQCVRDGGVDVEGSIGDVDFSAVAQEAPGVFEPCRERISAEHGIPHFGG